MARIERAAAGELSALDPIFTAYRDRLIRLVTIRLDPRLQRRVDASDVVQEGLVDAWGRIGEYLADPSRMPFYLWIRFLVRQRVADAHRRHFGAARNAGKEISLYRSDMPEVNTAALVAHLLGHITSPSEAAIRAERSIRLQEALSAMDEIDREILVLRHYEQLSNGDAALVLGLDKSATSKRYIRALLRLKEHLRKPDGTTGERYS
ncbi:MAG TPA: sigma-70 family RNA polymerase sigma factor [Isosphaeraceae bacterium]|nr:sigma-70 family RNA polymerase sigma factor [Isosphaeraceae bacterium]